MNKMPIEMLMDMAKKDIGETVEQVMRNNHIPLGLMIFILESISNDIARLKHIQDAQMTIENAKANADKEKEEDE